MKLERIDYSENDGTPQEWRLQGLTLKSRNLLVGKNASGKSRTLNVIAGLAKHLSERATLGLSGTYKCEFRAEGHESYYYSYSISDREIVAEELRIGSKVVLQRQIGGFGKIWAEKLNSELEFQTPPATLAAVTRRDIVQHGFLEPLYKWASDLRHYTFGASLGKEHFAVLIKDGTHADARDQNSVVGLFLRARKEYESKFIDSLVSDLRRVSYEVDSIDAGAPLAIKFSDAPGEIIGLILKEAGLPGITDQISMSQGMFRVVSLLVHINYCQLSNPGSMVLIDDIGEGLDFDRSCRLIELLREKADASQIQLVMSSNDRFVMNNVPLDEWSVLQRVGGLVKVRNTENSREIFESFRFTGLSNFSFLEMDFINSPDADLAVEK